MIGIASAQRPLSHLASALGTGPEVFARARGKGERREPLAPACPCSSACTSYRCRMGKGRCARPRRRGFSMGNSFLPGLLIEGDYRRRGQKPFSTPRPIGSSSRANVSASDTVEAVLSGAHGHPRYFWNTLFPYARRSFDERRSSILEDVSIIFCARASFSAGVCRRTSAATSSRMPRRAASWSAARCDRLGNSAQVPTYSPSSGDHATR